MPRKKKSLQQIAKGKVVAEVEVWNSLRVTYKTQWLRTAMPARWGAKQEDCKFEPRVGNLATSKPLSENTKFKNGLGM